MATDLEHREPKDMTVINVHNEVEVHWWSTKFGVTPHALKAAVQEHGPSAADVERKLHDAARRSFSKGGED